MRLATLTSSSRLTVPCSRTPARMRARTYSRVFALNDYVVDAVLVEELSQEKAGGSASNDSNLCSQGRGPFYSSLAEIRLYDFFKLCERKALASPKPCS